MEPHHISELHRQLLSGSYRILHRVAQRACDHQLTTRFARSLWVRTSAFLSFEVFSNSFAQSPCFFCESFHLILSPDVVAKSANPNRMKLANELQYKLLITRA